MNDNKQIHIFSVHIPDVWVRFVICWLVCTLSAVLLLHLIKKIVFTKKSTNKNKTSYQEFYYDERFVFIFISIKKDIVNSTINPTSPNYKFKFPNTLLHILRHIFHLHSIIFDEYIQTTTILNTKNDFNHRNCYANLEAVPYKCYSILSKLKLRKLMFFQKIKMKILYTKSKEEITYWIFLNVWMKKIIQNIIWMKRNEIGFQNFT